MTKKSKKLKYRKKIFIYFLAIAIIPLLILGLYSYHSARDTVRKSVRQSNTVALNQIGNKVDSILDIISQNFFRIASSSQTVKFLEQGIDGIDFISLRDFSEDIGQDRAYMDYVSSYAMLNFKQQWVLSNKGLFPFEEIENREWVDDIEAKKEKLFWENHTGETEENLIIQEHVNHQYLTLVIKIPAYAEYNDAAFVVNINQAAFEKLLTQSMGNSFLTVFDQEGQLIYTENQEIADYYTTHPDLLEDSSQASILAGENSYDIVKQISDSSRWTFVAAYNPEEVNRELAPILFTMGCIILIVIFLIAFTSILGTAKVYQPVRELVSSMEEMVSDTGSNAVNGKKEEHSDEFSLINQGIHQLVGHNEELQDMIGRQKNQLAELFAYRLIRGSLNENEIEQTRTRLQVLQTSYFCIVSAIFCQKQENGNQEQMEQDVLNLEMMKQFPEEIRDMLLLPPFIYTRAILMVLGSNTKEKMEEKILALRNCMSIYATNMWSGVCGYMDMGVSRIFTEITGFRKAYHESLEALKINQYYERTEEPEGLSPEDSSITYYGDLTRKGNRENEYSFSMDAKIKEAVDSCDQQKAFQTVDEFLKDVKRSGAVLYEQHYYLHRLLMAILSVPADAGVPIHDLFPEGEGSLFLKFNQLYDYRTIRKFYEQDVIVPVIERLTSFRMTSSEKVMEKILKLIEDCKGDLTLAECAERLGYHPSYIWRVMKNTRNITFTDYVTEQKMEMAKNMLTETKMSIAEIADQLKYSNAQNFIRLFKKHMSMTPGQYRKSKKDN